MHRHGYKGRKLGRKKDQRRALIKSLADSLILEESIETTVSKAKEIRPYVENLITKAKKGSLSNRRYIISSLNTLEASHKLVDHIAPQLSKRNSGYLRIKRTTNRVGDNTELAKISFVDEIKESSPKNLHKAEKPEKIPNATKKTPAKKTTATKKGGNK